MRAVEPATPAAASLVRRLAAVGYEALLLGAVLLLAGFALAPAISSGAVTAHALQVPAPAGRALMLGALLTVGAVYFTWSWTGGRRTLPMKTWRIRLVDCTGNGLAATTALLRYFAAGMGPLLALGAHAAFKPLGIGRYAFWLVGLNYAWALVDRDRQFLHDRIARTRLVADPPPASTP